jgi:hypothetical protein
LSARPQFAQGEARSLHPVFAGILRAHGAPEQPTTYRAKYGRRREFLSESDARAYDQGFADFRDGKELTSEINTPHSAGWFDAEVEYLDAQFDRVYGEDE